MRVSVIIPLIAINAYIRESVPHLLRLDYPDFEIIILPNQVSESERAEFTDPRIRLIPTVESSPAYKRDLGAAQATGEILAFLDDDAYPTTGWLTAAVKHFINPAVGAVGGPAVTPASDPLTARLSGAVYTSLVGGGGYRYRYWPQGGVRSVDDYPSVNLLVRRGLFQTIGGFNSAYWPGEDTKLCLDIISAGRKIIYDPAVLVYHHRRPSLMKHLRQVAQYATHRGYFAKRFPQTSLRLSYFIPTAFVVFLVGGGLLAKLNGLLAIAYFSILIWYLILLVWSGITETLRARSGVVGLGVMPLIFATHLTYGIYFMTGLMTPKLQSTYRPSPPPV